MKTDPTHNAETVRVRVPLILLEYLAERFIAVDTADKLSLGALKSYIEAARYDGEAT
jgi:hypothetical protein